MAVCENASYKKIIHKKKTASGDRILHVFLYAFLVLYAAVTVYPVIHLLACSFNDPADLINGGVHLFPRSFTFENYIKVFEGKQGIHRGLLVTVARSVIGSTVSLTASALLSFILSRKRFLFKSGLSLFWLITMYASGGIVTTYILYKYLHLLRSFWVYIIPGIVSVFFVFVMKTYMQSIPVSLEQLV